MEGNGDGVVSDGEFSGRCGPPSTNALASTRVMSIPSAAIYMIGYEHLLSLMSAPRSTPYLSSDHSNPSTKLAHNVNIPSSTSQPYLTPTPFIAGCIARTISATVISPMELFRTRLQALPGPGEERPTYKNTAASIGKMIKQRGVTSLWRGLGPTLWRDVPFSGELSRHFRRARPY